MPSAISTIADDRGRKLDVGFAVARGKRLVVAHHECHRYDDEHGHVDQEHKRHAPVGDEEDDEGDERRKHGLHDFRRSMPDGLVHAEDVVGDRLLDLARAAVVEPSERELGEVVEQDMARVDAEVGIGLVADAGAAAEEHAVGRRERDGRDDHEGERACGGHGVAQGGLGYGDSYQVGDESAGRRQRRHDHALDDERMSRFGESQVEALQARTPLFLGLCVPLPGSRAVVVDLGGCWHGPISYPQN